MRNCRFLVFINGGDVKLTLRPDQKLEHYQGGPTDEGWSSEYHSWSLGHDGSTLFREYISDGSDCDGRLTRSNIARASTDPATFHAGYDPYKDRPKLFPYWTEDRAEQRDYAAEAMNY